MKPVDNGSPEQSPAETARPQPESRPNDENGRGGTGKMAGGSHSAPRHRLIESSEILAGCREAHIVHAGEVYRLLVTRNNKLILQK